MVAHLCLLHSPADNVYVQDFWRKCGDLGLLGITAPCKLSLIYVTSIIYCAKLGKYMHAIYTYNRMGRLNSSTHEIYPAVDKLQKD